VDKVERLLVQAKPLRNEVIVQIGLSIYFLHKVLFQFPELFPAQVDPVLVDYLLELPILDDSLPFDVMERETSVDVAPFVSDAGS
jgi:hypothetical protein